jgi:antitoxin CptB
MMTEATPVRVKRLKFRSWHRGTREADLVLGRFADRYLDELSESDLDAYERLLGEEDPDLWDWLTGMAPVPATHDTLVMQRLRGFHGAVSAT